MVYRGMAGLYDHLMAHAPYHKWVDFTEEKFQTSHIPIKKVADLGCGTGEITIRLAKQGYELVGVDYSEPMLALASEKTMEEGVTVSWLHQDIRNLEGLGKLDAAISFCDVINYITKPEEIEQTFKRVADTLKPGGLFLFDVHHLPFIMEYYLEETFADVTDKAAYIWFCEPGEEYGEMIHDLTFFQRNNGKYERIDEKHYQRVFSIDFYKEILKRTGFENIKVSADFALKQEIVDENAMRIFFSAEKKSR